MLDKNNQEHTHKILTKILIGWVVLVLVVGGVVISIETRGQAAPSGGPRGASLISNTLTSVAPSGIPVSDTGVKIKLTISDYLTFAYYKITDRLKTLSAVAYKNGINRLLSNVAQRSAETLAAGMNGKKPAFETNLREYVKEEVDGAVGDYLNNTVGKMWGKNLCEPLDPVAKVNIQILGKNVVSQGKPSCKFTTVMKRVKDLKKLSFNELVEFSSYFDPTSNDLGAVLTITSGALDTRVANEKLAEWVKDVEGEFKPLKSVITGDVKTPASLYAGLGNNMIDTSLKGYETYTGNAIADAIGVFANTLTNKLLQNLFNKGLYQKSRVSSGAGGAYAPGGAGQQATVDRFAALGTPDYNFSGAEVDIMDSLSCGVDSQYSCTVDNAFKEAVAQKLTLAQAMEKNLVHKDWPVGYNVNKNGGTDGMNKGIYSYRTLMILRKYRIIPVTWELAAEYYYKFDRSGKPLTLELLASDAYYNNQSSPYYRLVDKGWVLKAPETICQRQGAGEEVLQTEDTSVDANGDGEISDNERSTMVIRNNNYCADERSCIKEGNVGSPCGAFGYCTKEKSVWKIAGVDGDCPEYYNTCQTYTKRDGTTISYLKNTLFGLGGECSEANSVGCQEYCASLDPNNGWTCNLAEAGTRIYLNAKAEENECSGEEAGCSQFVRMNPSLNTPSNWIPNSSFNYFKGTDRVNFDPANNSNDFVKVNGSGTIEEGALKLSGNLTIDADTQKALKGRIFVFSLNSKNSGLEAKLTTTGGTVNKLGVSAMGDYYWLTWQYTFTTTDTNITIEIPGLADNLIDDLQLVETSTESPYREYGTINVVNMRKAPVEYSCQDYAKIIDGDKDNCSGTWRSDIQRCVEGGMAACQDYAMYCSEADMGCQNYTPVSFSGAAQPGIIGPDDMCPKDCVGYKSYLEQPTFFIPKVANTPVNFIASTARVCPVSDVGCEEFTNLSAGASGENKEYFSSFRACVLPSQTSSGIETFYTWVSGDEAGNQLRKWELLKSDDGDFPCTNTVTAADGQVACADKTAGAKKCVLGDTDPNNNPATNPDCMEFTNTAGVATWLKFSQIVYASEECTQYRMTSSEAGDKVYSAIPSLSQRCAAASVGCREYKGSTSNNISEIINDNFENNQTSGWSGGTVSNESVSAGGHSLDAGGSIGKDVTGQVLAGRSYRLSFWAKSKGSGSNILTASFSGDLVFSGQVEIKGDWGQYTVNLLDFSRAPKAGEQLQIKGSSGFFIDNIILSAADSELYVIKNSWQTPAVCDQPNEGEMLGCEAYKDKNNKEWYAKSFTKVCYDFAVGCEQMIDTFNTEQPFAQEYNVETSGNEVRDDVKIPADSLIYLVYDEGKACNDVGCTSLGLMKMNADNTISYTNKHLILDPNNFGGLNGTLCLAKSVGCDQFQSVGENSGGYVYFKDPGAFVCEYRGKNGVYGWYKAGSNEPCPSFATSGTTGSGYCSNDPTKDCVTAGECLGGAACLFERHCVGGRAVNDSNALDNKCTADTGDNGCMNYATGKLDGLCSTWTALCSEEASTCTEYQDANSPEDCNRASVNYEYTLAKDDSNNILKDKDGNPIRQNWCDFYYYKADQVETCSSVDPVKGCLGFHQTDGGDDVWYSVPRCEKNPEVKCETDSDCISSSENWGRCTYIAQ